MKNILKENMRQVLIIILIFLCVFVLLSSASGNSLDKKDLKKDRYDNFSSYNFRPLYLPSWFYAIVNDDWNYWTSSPDMYAIPTGNIGIGTINPETKLDVHGTVKMTGFSMPTGANNGYVLTSDSSGDGSWEESTGGIGGSGTSNYIPKFVGSTLIGNSEIYELNGNIGIGTTNPTSKLHVVEDEPPITGGDKSINFKGDGIGVRGFSGEGSGVGGGSDNGNGVQGVSTHGNGVYGWSPQDGIGVYGASYEGPGVVGYSEDNNGVTGHSDNGIGVYASSDTGTALYVQGSSEFHCNAHFHCDVIMEGKLTAAGGIDPPYISFSKETHESIREYANYVEDHEEVMQFWNGDTHRMEIYVISEDVFYTFTGDLIEE